MRLPWPAVAGGVLVAVVGAVGLIRGEMPQSAASDRAPRSPGAVTVTGAYIRPPVPPTKSAAAYFTVYNTTASDDRLVDVETGASETAVLHATLDGRMTAIANGVVIPAHGSLVLTPGKGHVMIEHLFGKLEPGQDVDLQLDFQKAGQLEVVARVIAFGKPAPTAGTQPQQGESGPSTPSGAHS